MPRHKRRGGSGLVLAAVALLSGCTAAPLPQDQLITWLQSHLVSLPDRQFQPLAEAIAPHDIVFLGEQHHVGELIYIADSLVVDLAADRPVVYALETCYGLHAFLEAASMGEPDPLMPLSLSPVIARFNAAAQPDNRILVTAVDVEHSVYHSKAETAAFLNQLAGRSRSSAARQALCEQIALLLDLDGYEQVDAYLKQLNQLFLEHIDSFSPADQQEIKFAMALLPASNQYQYAQRGLRQNLSNPQDIRYDWFCRTIERAYRKAQDRHAILVCRVGSWHANFSYRCEARYFARDYPPTRGKVMAIQMVPQVVAARRTGPLCPRFTSGRRPCLPAIGGHKTIAGLE